MADDLANSWGRVLHPEIGHRRDFGGYCGDLGQLKRSVQEVCFPFTLQKVLACGSDANLFAIAEATDGDPSRCLVACGSYVAGDHGCLQTLSTSEFDLRDNLALVQTENVHPTARSRTIPLPYHVPCKHCQNGKELQDLEAKCLDEIHVRCLTAALQGLPYKAIFLELILAGNGASLSHAFLKKLGAIARHHKFHLIVDEIMTGGRTGKMLHTHLLPHEFQKVVSHITMGKWIGIGIVLHNSKLRICDKAQLSSRGVTTAPDFYESIHTWQRVVSHLHLTAARRAAVLQKLKVKEENAWGAGVLIFVPICRLDSKGGLKSRLLPLITADTPIDTVKFSKRNAYSKESCCRSVTGAVVNWLNIVEYTCDPTDRAVCSAISSSFRREFFQLKELRAHLSPQVENNTIEKTRIGSSVLKAVKAKLLALRLQGTQRKHGYQVTSTCIFDT